MKIKEVVVEARQEANFSSLDPDQQAKLRSAISLPGISLNHPDGSAYKAYRFGLAMAGAPEFPTHEAGAVAGDPLLSCYTDEELEIINSAAKMVGAGKVTRLSSNRSEELSNTNTQSPLPAKRKNKYGV